jgi:general secretion pathway protein G
MVVAAAVVLWAGAAQAQPAKEPTKEAPKKPAKQPSKSPADFVPAKVLAYAEVRQIGKLANEVRSLFQDSAFGNVPGSLEKFLPKDGRREPGNWSEFAMPLGLMLCPEVVKEVSRIKGVGVSLLGINQHGMPDFLAVVLPGDSQAPPFFLRTYLTMDRHVQAIGKVEGVAVYQDRRVERPSAVPAVAMMPGAIFIGSPDAVKDAIRRAKGKGEGGSLAESKGYQEASKEAAKEPGLFAYVNPPAVVEAVEGFVRAGGGNQEAFAELLKEVNPSAFRMDIYNVTLSKGTFRARRTTLLNPKEKSLALDLLPTAPASADVLHFAPKDAMLVAALSNAGGEKRWASLLKFADLIAAIDGKQGVPNQIVQQFEQGLGVNLGKDVFGKITNVGFAVGDPLKAPVKKTVEKGENFEAVHVTHEVPILFVVQTADEDTAKKMVEELMPKVVTVFGGGKEVEPKASEVDGQKLYTIPMGRHEHLHYGRKGATIVLGPYAVSVRKALAAGAAKEGWLALAKHAEQVKAEGEPLAFLAAKPVTAAMSLFLVRSQGSVRTGKAIKEARPIEDKPPPPPVKKGKESQAQDAPALAAEKGVKVQVEVIPADKTMQGVPKELAKLLENQEMLTYSLNRKDDRLIQELRFGGLKALVPRLTDFIVEQSLHPHGDTKKGAARVNAQTIAKACDLYKLKNGNYPVNLEVLLQVGANGDGPYLADPKVLIDPWGNPYQYDPAGPQNRGIRADVWAVGPDGQKYGNW